MPSGTLKQGPVLGIAIYAVADEGILTLKHFEWAAPADVLGRSALLSMVYLSVAHSMQVGRTGTRCFCHRNLNMLVDDERLELGSRMNHGTVGAQPSQTYLIGERAQHRGHSRHSRHQESSPSIAPTSLGPGLRPPTSTSSKERKRSGAHVAAADRL